ncbi:hypothetical protein D3C81_1392160 [compost metagenome]
MGDQRHLRRNTTRRGQRAHHVEAGHLDQHHGYIHMLAQIGAVGAARHHHIDTPLARLAVDGTGGGLEGPPNDAELRPGRVGRDQFGEGPRETADAHRPDPGTATGRHGGRVEGRGGRQETHDGNGV